MAELDDLIYSLTSDVSSMSRLLTNLKKQGQRNFTVSGLQTRLTKLNEIWDQCQALDGQIYKTATTEERTSHAYFTEETFINAEQTYWEVSDYISNALAARTTSPGGNSSQAVDGTFRDGARGNSTPLPRIPMPTFSGSYTDWVSFRDLFESLVNKNDSLSNVEKLHYLKVSVEGEASSLLKNITITDANFQVAWNALLKRYNQSRHIIDAQLMKLFDIPAVSSESVRELKHLRDQTSEAVSALSNLERNVDTWDDVLAFITVRKLDAVSRREWEMKIGEKEEYPTYQEINKFLDYRIRALESISPPSVTPPSVAKAITQGSNGKDATNSVKSHLSTASKCCECNGDHALHKCDQFKNKNAEQRQKIVRDKQLCYNCLSSHHQTKQCPSKHTCFQCKKKHHTLLHNNDYQTKKKTDQTQLSFPSGNALPTSRPVEASTPKPNSTQSLPSTSIESLHASQNQTSKAVMLATAWVRLEAPNGRSVRVRALLDQGSESSFVTESVAQSLKAPRTKVHTTVTGIAGSFAGTGRSSVHLTLKPCHSDSPSLLCEALVFQKLTPYVPKGNVELQKWNHVVGLELADPDPSSADPIQLIIGAEMYACVFLTGVKLGPEGSPLAQQTLFGWILSGRITTTTRESSTGLSAHIALSESNISVALRRFWELEEVPTCSPLTEEETKCEAHFAATHRRLSEGRYSVKLPFKNSNTVDIGASTQVALNWMLKLERKFTRNPDLAAPYCEFMQEYLDLGHMVRTTFNSPESNPGVFLPHHPVIKDSSTTRLRVVFNASSRGLPSDLYSDNGTTFVGADKELRNAYRTVIQDPNVVNLLATDHVNWHFIPPGAPHFGGLWEAGVKCTKHHLRRVLSSKTLTFEELTTLIAQIEACLNSRPIGPLRTDPSEFAVLTPGHFLIGAPLTSVPEPTLLDLNENRLSRWQLVRQTLELFWKRWSSEYLHTLQVRTKWTQPTKNVQIGDLVLVRNANLPPSKWLLGRITTCHPGVDERVRVVTIKTAHSELKRPITQICVLPIHSSESSPNPAKSSSTELSFHDCTDIKSESSDSPNLD